MEDICAIAQAEEVELLQSMYSEGELTFGRSPSDHEAVQPSSFTVQVVVDVEVIEIEFRVPKDYPYKNFPTVFIRGHGAFNYDRINSDLRDWIHQQQLGLPLVAEIISWVIENNAKYRTTQGDMSDGLTESCEDNFSKEFARYYILSHHLRSPIKRSNIMQLAKELHLCGFFTPGKPAVILVEGETSACEEFWKNVKSWTWKKISLRHSEMLRSVDDRRFTEFAEIAPNPSGTPMGNVKRLLIDARLEDKFSLLYGL